MSGVGAAAVRRAWVASASIAGTSAAAASGRAWPQLAQNFASAATLASHRGQLCGGDSTLIGPIVAQGGHGARSGDRLLWWSCSGRRRIATASLWILSHVSHASLLGTG